MAHALDPMPNAEATSQARPLKVFMITSEWPTPEHPEWAPFIVRQVEYLRRAGVEVDVYTFRGAKDPWNYFRAWQVARRRIRDGQYDLVHAQWGQSALLALPKHRPLVITYRGNDLEGIVGPNGRYSLPGHLLRAVSRAVSRAADEVIVVSDHLGRLIPERSYHVVPSGLDLARFEPVSVEQARTELGLPLDQRLVLFAANPKNARKRHTLARAAVERLPADLRARLVVAHGVRYEQIPLYMSACDALVLTSMHEGSPNVVKEALACNLPVVAVDVGDVRERIGGVEGCVVCDDDRPGTIAAALAEVLRSGRRIEGRPAVHDLDEQRTTERVIGIYRQALTHG